ncbi:hypothetical protein [Peribacillus frigoritolerans]|uniref:hypothetical protein n=1 Tax=Peribacillus frigoritolerans TaxID=450367 RepID=UPI0031CFF09C
MHSLSAGGPGSLLGKACGVSLGHAFPAGVSYLTFQSTGTFFKIKTAGWAGLFRTKFSLFFEFFSCTPYWMEEICETPQTLASRRLGRQSAERADF